MRSMTAVALCMAACAGFVSCGNRPARPVPPAAVQPAPAQQQHAGAVPAQARPGLWITKPADGASAAVRTLVEGTVSDSSAHAVRLLVHPVGGGSYIAQRTGTARADGIWSCTAYIVMPAGSRVEVRAVANPRTQLKPNDTLTAWPDAQYSSNIITVTALGK